MNSFEFVMNSFANTLILFFQKVNNRMNVPHISELNGHLGVLGEFGVLLQSQRGDCARLDDAFSWSHGEAVDFDL